MIKIIYTFIPEHKALPLGLLNPEEQEYASRMPIKRQKHFVYGRALLRQHFMRMGCNVASICLELPADQPPVLNVNNERIALSISHCGNLVAAAYSRCCQIGLDVELIKARNGLAMMVEELPVFAPLQRGEGPEPEMFYRYWTKCEAYSKFSGQPLLSVLQQPLPDSPEFFCLPLSQYMLCLCYPDTDTPIAITEESL